MKKGSSLISGVILVILLVVLALFNGPARQQRAVQPSKLAGGPERDVRNIGEQDLERLYPGIILRTGKDVGKLVSLTFDDGPDATYTPAVLDVLKQKNVKATFFLIGKRVEENPAIAKRIADEGHLIGNHTYSHANLDKASPEVEQELSKAEAAFKPLGFSGNGLFRPAYGAANPSLVEQVSNLGYKIAMWSVDTLDWRGLSAAEVLRNVTNTVTPGAVILQHSAGGPGEDLSGSVAAIPQIIDQLQAQGYRFVRMDEMFPLDRPNP
ncbi:MAG: polysaccharide deacetylase family protein [Bacillota bacterium]